MNVWQELVTYFGLDQLSADASFSEILQWYLMVLMAVVLVVELFRAMMNAVNMFTKFR